VVIEASSAPVTLPAVLSAGFYMGFTQVAVERVLSFIELDRVALSSPPTAACSFQIHSRIRRVTERANNREVEHHECRGAVQNYKSYYFWRFAKMDNGDYEYSDIEKSADYSENL
jgi:hypothetical protein